MEPVIREAVPDELPALAALYCRVRRDEFFWEPSVGPDDFYRDTRGEAILTAHCGNGGQGGQTAAGFISVWAETKFVHCLYVDAAFRGQGVGRRLVDAAARRFGTPLTLKCMRANTAALRFYEKTGWTVTDVAATEKGPCCVLVRGDVGA